MNTKSLREPSPAPARKRRRAAAKKKAAVDPLIALETEYDRADAAWLAAGRAQEQAEIELWRNQPHYVSMPAVMAGDYHVMSEEEIHARCQPVFSAGPSETERDALLADFQRRQKAYPEAREKAGLKPFDDAVEKAQKDYRAAVKAIIATPAVSLEGIAVKVRRLAEDIYPDTNPDESALAASVLEALERLAEGGAS